MNAADEEAVLGHLYAEAKRLEALIGVPADLQLHKHKPEKDGFWLTVYWREAGDGDEEDGTYVALMKAEDGQIWELGETSVASGGELLFTFFQTITHQMAKREISETSSGAPRCRLFSSQSALMEKVNSDWARRTRQRHQRILLNSPFED